MTGQVKREIIESNEVIGYWEDGLAGIEVHKIDYTPDGIIFYIKTVGYGEPTYHIRKVVEQYTIDGSHQDYIRLGSRRWYLKDCIKVF